MRAPAPSGALWRRTRHKSARLQKYSRIQCGIGEESAIASLMVFAPGSSVPVCKQRRRRKAARYAVVLGVQIAVRAAAPPRRRVERIV